MERKEIFSIKKLKVGAASVLIGTGIVFLGSKASVALANEPAVETTSNRNSDDVDDNSVNSKNSPNNDKMGVNSSTTPQQMDTDSIKPTENNSNSSIVDTTSEVTNRNRKKISKRSKRALTDPETIDYSGAKISGRLIDGNTQYAVGEQILGSYNLDISEPTKIEEGGYILITASDNE
uniref:YSIRK-type signal peptide-containing protein n=1 Tax=uncultured Gemella sp. TaxID=254352 RepID=UPI0028D06F66